MPREKLLRGGSGILTDRELLAILIGTGIKGRDAGTLAEEVLDILDKSGYKVSLDKLTGINGLGTAKAAVIAASMEFARRAICPEKKKISGPKDIMPLIRHYGDRDREHFLCLSLNGAHEVRHIRIVSIGLVNKTLVHPREVFSDPIKDRAAAVIVAHNHPSGNTAPSAEDIDITNRIKKAGDILGIPLLDHIIFSEDSFYSFMEERGF